MINNIKSCQIVADKKSSKNKNMLDMGLLKMQNYCLKSEGTLRVVELAVVMAVMK